MEAAPASLSLYCCRCGFPFLDAACVKGLLGDQRGHIDSYFAAGAVSWLGFLFCFC